MTLNQEASSIANTLRQPFNHELKERAKDLIKQALALHIRRSVKEHGIDNTLLLSYSAEIVNIPKYEEPITELKQDYKIRTKYRVPTPVRFKNDAPFTYVGTNDGTHSFPMRNPGEALNMHSYSSTGESYSYYIHNGFIVINSRPYHTFKGKYILVESIFENPEEVITMYKDDDGQNIQLPFPADILAIIRNDVIQSLGSIMPDDIKVTYDKPNQNAE